MKKSIIALTLIAASSFATASPTEQEKELCVQIANFAKVSMTTRQNGMPLTEAMTYSTMKLTDEVLMQAYDEPVFSSDKYKQSAITEFENQWYLNCLTVINK